MTCVEIYDYDIGYEIDILDMRLRDRLYLGYDCNNGLFDDLLYFSDIEDLQVEK